MGESHGSEPGARRPFLFTAYAVGADGKLVAVRPDRCPRYGERGDEACRVWLDHHRDRKTGPCFPLPVMRCGPHDRRFTLYPHGHVPYGRVAVAPVTPDGALMRDEPRAPDEAAAAQPSGPPLGWSSTIFGAALDASAGRAWPRKRPARWRTQRRWLVRGARLVGIAPRAEGDERRHRERIARRLAVPTVRLVAAARRWATAGGYRDRGAAIVEVIDEMERARTVAERLLSAGAVAGLWGLPCRWESDIRVIRRLPFS